MRGSRGTELAGRIADVVEAGNCTGCGACTALSPAISMALDESGFLRPQVAENFTDQGQQLSASFDDFCPGVAVTAARPEGARRHPMLGPYVSAWVGWATDETTRFGGSSAGVLTALSVYLLETGQAKGVAAAHMDPGNARRTVPLVLRTRAEALSAAGSRYAPVGNAELFEANRSDVAFVGKPCEVYAARRQTDALGTVIDSPPLLSFFCAGTPSQRSTDGLIEHLGSTGDTAISVRYRGNGWPGDFTVVDSSGRRGSMSYEQSWGGHLGRDLQDRCKICPDGTGGHADVSVGDYWESDNAGFPLFEEGAGQSAVIARTRRGHDLLMAAEEAGFIHIEPVDLDAVAAVQPLQTKRVSTLLGRLVGRIVGGRRVPRYRGFGLARRFLDEPGANVQSARGTYSRVRRAAGKVAK